MKTKAPRFLVFIGTVILILVPTAFTAVGWQTIRLECARHDGATAPSCEVQNGYLFGLFKTSPRRIENVSGVGYGTSSIRNPGNTGRTTLSTVFLDGERGSISVFETSSNVNEKQKRDVIKQLKGFLEDKTQPSFRMETWFSNLFGWVGLPLFLVVVIGFTYSVIWYTWQAIRRLIQ